MKYTLLLLALFNLNLLNAQYRDFVIFNNGDTLFCDILENLIDYKVEEHELEIIYRRKIMWYNGFHGIIAKIGQDSFYFLESNQIKGYYQADDFVYEKRSGFHKRKIRYSEHDRFSGFYKQFDLGKLANHNRGTYRFRFILATPANKKNLDYEIKFNSPFKLYICWMSIENSDYQLDFILSDGKDVIFISSLRQLIKASKKYNIPVNSWKRGGGRLRQFVLRFQFALNEKVVRS
jgi:hypothetical protein